MNRDETRLKEIREFKIFYNERLKESESELETDLLNMRLKTLENEEINILKRCNAI